MITEMYVYLGIDNLKVDPNRITELVDVEPTRIYRIGDKIRNSKIKSKSNSWEFRIDNNQDYDLNSMVKDILSRFANKESLKKAISLGEAEIVCVLYTKDTYPTITIERGTVKELAELNCGFWLDYYIIPKTTEGK